MRKFLRPVLIGFASFLLGVACLLAFFRLSPDTGRSLLGVQDHPRERKPIQSAFNLAPHKDDEEDQQALPPPLPGQVPSPGAQAGGQPPPIFDQDDADFFGGQDPLVAARKLHEQIEKEMAAGFAGLGGGGMIDMSNAEKITEKEDDKSFSYEIQGVEGSSLNTSVKDGYLTIRGETKRQAAGISIQSTFQRSFPLPPNVDPSKMETISEKDKVVLRFPKRSS